MREMRLEGLDAAVGGGGAHGQLLLGLHLSAADAHDVERLEPGQAQALGVLPGQELERQHAHAHQVAAVDALEALGDDRLDAQQARPLGRPVAAGAGAVFLAGQDDRSAMPAA